jgi:hypothetical protein
MVAEKCPNCGAGIAPSTAKCEYCGTAFSDAPDTTWTRVDHHLPPPDPAHPGRSIYVIILDLADGLTFINKKTKEVMRWWDFELSIGNPYFLISAYYDFNTKKWHNDTYSKRLDGYKYSSLNNPTHWMHIPSIASSAWVAVADRMPPALPPSDYEIKSGNLINRSFKTLLCDKSVDFDASVIIGQYVGLEDVWDCSELDFNLPKNAQQTTEQILAFQRITRPTHWMPYPCDGPIE